MKSRDTSKTSGRTSSGHPRKRPPDTTETHDGHGRNKPLTRYDIRPEDSILSINRSILRPEVSMSTCPGITGQGPRTHADAPGPAMAAKRQLTTETHNSSEHLSRFGPTPDGGRRREMGRKKKRSKKVTGRREMPFFWSGASSSFLLLFQRRSPPPTTDENSKLGPNLAPSPEQGRSEPEKQVARETQKHGGIPRWQPSECAAHSFPIQVSSG